MLIELLIGWMIYVSWNLLIWYFWVRSGKWRVKYKRFLFVGMVRVFVVIVVISCFCCLRYFGFVVFGLGLRWMMWCLDVDKRFWVLLSCLFFLNKECIMVWCFVVFVFFVWLWKLLRCWYSICIFYFVVCDGVWGMLVDNSIIMNWIFILILVLSGCYVFDGCKIVLMLVWFIRESSFLD